MATNDSSITNPYKNCTGVSAACPINRTVLGYYPNLGSGYFFAIAFALCLVATVVLGVAKRTWTYSAALTCGLVLEIVGAYDQLTPSTGYIGRIQLSANPWNGSAFKLQISTIILGPTFICISIYLTVKHVALALNPSVSRIPANWYPLIFLPADVSCIVIQAIGGGIAAAASNTKPELQKSGNRAIIAGVVLQVLVLGAFGAMGTDYLVRVSRFMRLPEAQDTDGIKVWHDGRFRTFTAAVSVAYLAIFIRCIYRIAGMAGGWGNHIMQDEPSFLILDGTPILVATAALTIVHPGIFFPQMSHNAVARRADQKSARRSAAADGDMTYKAKV
ncbi:hypothetical protein PWT90_05909 [Aphanocladium album]|nr:hypothetical protein PWT90_05909 [Aphanocladium album]